MELGRQIATLLIGIVSGSVGTMAGGAGLIGIPFLIFLGLPPQTAIATHKLGGVGLSLGGLLRFLRSNEIAWPYVIRFSLLAFAGSFTGAQLLMRVDEQGLKQVIIIILIVLLPVVLLQKDLGIEAKPRSKGLVNAGYLFYGLGMTWAGFIGAGSGAMIFYILMYFFGFTINGSSATQKIPSLVSTATALTIFIIHGLVNWHFGFALFAGMMLGGYLGAHLALRMGNAWVKGVFIVMVLALTIKLMIG